MTVNITQCPSCGSRRLKRKRENWSRDFEGQAYRVRGLEFLECPDCGEKVFDREAMRKIEAQSPAFRKASHMKRSA